MKGLRRYFWPRTAVLFYIKGEEIVAAFGFLEKKGVEIVERRHFTLSEKSRLIAWVEEIVRTYPRTYVGSILDTYNQGALPACGKSVLKRFDVDATLIRALCIDEKWLAYTSLVEMKWFEQKFKGMDVDLLFSPFVLLYEHAADSLDDTATLYMLHFRGLVFALVLTRERAWYANIFFISQQHSGEASDEEEIEDLAFDLEMLDEEAEVEPIDEIGGLEDLKDSNVSTSEDEEALERLEYTLNLFEELKKMIKNFYDDERYEKCFIERVVVYDLEDLGQDFVRYIKEELFMEAEIHPYDPIETLAKMVANELEGA